MIFYRYEDTVYYEIGVRVNVNELKYYLVKETPCGYWIHRDPKYEKKKLYYVGDKKRWISKTARKRFAYPSRREAMVSFLRRKERQIEIYESRLIRAKSALHEGQVRHEKILEEEMEVSKNDSNRSKEILRLCEEAWPMAPIRRF